MKITIEIDCDATKCDIFADYWTIICECITDTGATLIQEKILYPSKDYQNGIFDSAGDCVGSIKIMG